MTSGGSLVDYFVISGLDVSSGLEPDQLSGDSLHCPPLDRPYKPKILAHYPENLPHNPFDKDAVCMLCHPKGLRFQIHKDKRETYFHSFLITKEDGSRLCGAALTFFEIVDNRQICVAMQTLQAMHMAELSNIQSRTLYSHLGHVHSRSPKRGHRPDPLTMGRMFDHRKDMLYGTKTICIISQIPLVNTYEKILRSLLELIQSQEQPKIPLECYIYNLIYEIPVPPPGRSMKITTYSQSLMCQRPGVTELPLMDYHMREMFHLLGVDNVLNLFSCILLERQVLLYSLDYQRLMLVAECITSLIFPFQWQHVYVPILPASLLHFLDAPVPFVMGLHHSTDGKSLAQHCVKGNMCFVDIDNGTVEPPEDLPTFPYRDDLKEELLLHLNFQFDHLNGHLRDSGFRDSFVGCDSGLSSEAGSASSSTWSLASKLELLQQSEALAKITALAKKTGVISSLEDISDSLVLETEKIHPRVREDKHLEELVCNNYIREIFLHYFMQTFSSYEAFVIQPGQDMESWLNNRDTMQNFDKAAFLSDHPVAHLPFLSAFIETQMFTTFIDYKIIAQWEEPDPQLKVFEARLRYFKERTDDQREPQHHRHSMCRDAESIVEKRGSAADIVAPTPHSLEGFRPRTHRPEYVPQIQARLLSTDRAEPKMRREARWRKKERLFQHSEHLRLNSDQREKYIQEARAKGSRQPKLSDMNPAHMAQTNWKFVATLLKECKAKTKRMLVQKMGQEAIELGHGEATLTGVEENTLIASLCDLLERIWSHGLQKKEGKSALWNHLLAYQEIEMINNPDNPDGSDPNLLTPDMTSVALEGDQQCPSGTQTWPVRRHRRKGSRGPELPVLDQMPVSVLMDMRNVQQMMDIKTDVGYARAWVRLALEKKVLSKHLKELLQNTQLLRSMYKRYAFLRCEDEREQFLYHLLSLNAVDYHCFTNTFTSTIVPYRVMIFPRQKLGGGSTTANPWFQLSGQKGETDKVQVPKHTLDVYYEHKNLGVLTTIRIGHDNAGMSPRWMVEHILVRNEITGQTYRFPCGRWLGKGVDDGSTERLLVAEAVHHTTNSNDLMEKCRTPPRCRSPSMPRKSNEPKVHISNIQEMLGDAVNNLVKHFYKPEKERGSVNATRLLCGEYGLVYCMEHVFQCGFKSSRFLRNRFFVWDFLEKVVPYFESLLTHPEEGRYGLSDEAKVSIQSYCRVVNAINRASQSVGKDGRFQVFICIGVRDHILQQWIKALSRTPVALSMYEERSFLRDPGLVTFLVHILDSLNEFNVTLEASLVKGIDDA